MNFLLLQINDSAFPIGGYTQSYGIETYVQKQLLHDKQTVTDFLRTLLKNCFLYGELLTVRLAYEYAGNQNLQKLVDLEQLYKAAKTPQEIRQASNKIGNRFYKATASMGLGLDMEFYHNYYARCGKNTVSHAVLYGIFCACANIDKDEVLQNYLYSQSSAHITNCVKLIPLSQTEGQQILFSLTDVYAEVLEQVLQLTTEQLFANAPAYDIYCMQHETLYSRLYMS